MIPYPECRTSGETLPPLPTARGGRAKTLVSRRNSVLRTVNRFTPPSRKRKASNYSTGLQAISKHCGLSSIPYPVLMSNLFRLIKRTTAFFKFVLVATLSGLTLRMELESGTTRAVLDVLASGMPDSIPYPALQLTAQVSFSPDGIPTARTSPLCQALGRIASHSGSWTPRTATSHQLHT